MATDTKDTDKPARAERLKHFPDKSGKDIPLRARVHQPAGDQISGEVAYRVRDGRDQRPRIGVKVDHRKGQPVLSRGRKVQHIAVDSDSLVVDKYPDDEKPQSSSTDGGSSND